MTIVETSDGYTYSIPETLPTKPADRVVTEFINLDATDGDGTHLLLKGTLPSGDEYIRCEDANGVEQFGVSHDGSIRISNMETSAIPDFNAAWSVVVGEVETIEILSAQTLKVEDADPVRRLHVDNTLVAWKGQLL